MINYSYALKAPESLTPGPGPALSIRVAGSGEERGNDAASETQNGGESRDDELSVSRGHGLSNTSQRVWWRTSPRWSSWPLSHRLRCRYFNRNARRGRSQFERSRPSSVMHCPRCSVVSCGHSIARSRQALPQMVSSTHSEIVGVDGHAV